MPIYNREDNLSPEEEQVLAEQRRLKAQSDSDPEELTFQERWIVMRLFRRVATATTNKHGLEGPQIRQAHGRSLPQQAKRVSSVAYFRLPLEQAATTLNQSA